MIRIFRSSVAYQYAAMTFAFIFLSAAVIVGVMHYNLRSYVLEDAANDARDATRAMAVLYGAAIEDASVALKDGGLTAIHSEAMPELANHDLVDRTASSIAGVATVFAKQGADYVRISTNVKKEDGSRAVGTKLAPEHPAQAVLANGEPYFGPAQLFGRDFMTGYSRSRTPPAPMSASFSSVSRWRSTSRRSMTFRSARSLPACFRCWSSARSLISPSGGRRGRCAR